MADYTSLKVTELKDELKKRGIPTTNLTRKQQIIDRLTEDDAEKESPADAQVLTTEETKTAALAPEPVETTTTEPTHDAQDDKDHAAAELDIEVPEPVEDVAPSEEPESTVAADDPSTAADTIRERSPMNGTDDPTTSQILEDVTPVVETHASESAPVEPSIIDSTPDSKKRKRRSVTPPVSQETVNKKLKQADDEVVHLEKDEVATGSNGDTVEQSADVDMSDLVKDQPDATVQPMASIDDMMTTTAKSDPVADQSITEHVPAEGDAVPPKTTRSPNERRFKNLINPSTNTDHETSTPHAEPDMDVEISPALHPATRALYIRELVRPINPSQLRDHLEHLATPPDRSSPGDVVEDCYIDALRTHAFVLFTSISAASRVRASTQGRIWPPEPNRKPLWVDFIPEDKVRDWIETERASGGSRPSQAKKWEVDYDVRDEGVEVSLVEAIPGASASNRPSFPVGVPGAPTGPRGTAPGPRRPSFTQSDVRRPSQPLGMRRPTAKAVEETSASFLELDKLFRFTTTKPKLYWQPVSDELADKRLDELDRETSRDWNPRLDAKRNGDSLGRGLDSLKRYTFEDGDVLVDGGPEYGGGRAFDRGAEGFRGRGGGRRGDRYR